MGNSHESEPEPGPTREVANGQFAVRSVGLVKSNLASAGRN